MSEVLTPRDLDMLRDAVFQRAADARNKREEDRWHSLDSKLLRMKTHAGQAECRCGHLRSAHLNGDVVTTCRICQCQNYDHAVEVTR